jgi:hypothetical protein
MRALRIHAYGLSLKPGRSVMCPILPSSARLSRFVYNGTRDYMRGVSAHVSIGRAEVRGRLSDNYFILCRRG